MADRQAGQAPALVQPAHGEPFAFAGVWAELPATWRAYYVLHSCAIVTCPPNELHAPDPRPDARRPRPRRRGARSSTPTAPPMARLDLLVPAPDDALVAREVSDLVNDVRKDGPALIEPREEQGALF